MKKIQNSKTKNEILETHPFVSNVSGWFIRVDEISNNAFVVEAAEIFGRTVSKQGSEPNILQKEIEDELCNIPSLS